MMASMPGAASERNGAPARNPDTLPDAADPSGPCPRCGRVSNFEVVQSIPVSFRSDIFFPGGQRIPRQQVSVLECYGCRARTVVVEDVYVGGVRHGSSGQTYDEALRCLSAGAPNGAAALLRTALALIVADKGSETAKAKRDLSDKIKQMVRDGGPLGALGDWAEHVNLYGNAGAHPYIYGAVTPEEAKNTAALTRSMIELLYEAPARFERRRVERGR
jgi:hypothetical protein